MAALFVKERLVDHYIVSVDSTLLKAKGCLWHKSSMNKGVVPRPGIDIYARWDQSVSQSYQAVGQLVINSTQQQILVLRLTYKIVNALAIKSQLPQGVRYMQLIADTMMIISCMI